jgi:thiol-disulfide isomerase/thioredoxin
MRLVFTLLFPFLLAACGKTNSMDTQKKELPPAVAKLAASVEDQGGEHIRMPKIPYGYEKSRYLNAGPQEIESSLKGKVVLIDIWDYTCVNCIQTLPYIQSWAEKYKDKGLVIIGVHSPEFEFEKEPGNLEKAVARFKLTYPIIADNEYEIWNSLANRYWPAKYIFDSKGILRASHFGEGEYQEFEAFIQKLLLERDSIASLPELSALVRETDKPGAVCYRPTPETYIGFFRNKLANAEKYEPHKPMKFTLPAKLTPDELYLEGEWKVEREYANPTGNTDASLVISYEAKEANLVIKPHGGEEFKVLVEQDGKPVAKEDRGADITEENGKTYLFVKEPRMYNIINNSKFGRFKLTLSSKSPSFAAYAYTFTTACQTPGE